MRKLINGKYVTVSDFYKQDNLERREGAQDARHDADASITVVNVVAIDGAARGGQNASLSDHGNGFFQRALIKFGVAKPADSKPMGWQDDVNHIPFGAYVVAEYVAGGTVKIMRTRGNGLYDVATGDRVNPEMIAKWRRA